MGLLDETTGAQYYNGNNYGGYQFISLDDIINQFMFVYVGEDKIIPKAKRVEVAFHAQRAMQELSFDTFKSCKSQEIIVPATLQMILPQDYVNYTKINWVDGSGIKHPLYPTNRRTNPKKYQIDSNDEFLFDVEGNTIPSGNLIKNGNFHGGYNNWKINVKETTPGTQDSFTATTSTVTATAGDPVSGWFYGFNGNAIAAYNVPQWSGINQLNVPIKSGEEYKISYTLSGYTAGEWSVVIIDENGDYTDSGSVTSNGTHTATITAGGTASSFTPNQVFIRNKSATAGTDGIADVVIDDISVVRVGDENPNTTWENYKSMTPSENQDDYEDDEFWPHDGRRYGLDPQHAQTNGSFYIDCMSGKIHFSSNISGKTVILDYISDGLGTDEEMQVHKFAEEAMYKYISHGILSSMANIPEYQVARLKKERFAAVRKAKLRLSNIKLEEITQILRGKSKHIKH
jgi:hypothetical protein